MNDANSPVITAIGAPFPSFASLRVAHSELLQRDPKTDEGQYLNEVENFIRRAQATGALLSIEEERRASQTILNYWVTVLYRADRKPPHATLAENPTLALKINGVRGPLAEPSELGRALPKDTIKVKDAVLVQTARTGGPQLLLEGLQPDDVLEIELQDGLRIWSRVEDVPQDFARRSQRGQVSGTIQLPSELSIGPASRAGGGWAIKALKVLGLDVEVQIADFVGTHVEGQLQGRAQACTAVPKTTGLACCRCARSMERVQCSCFCTAPPRRPPVASLSYGSHRVEL